jgi:hypothetical protein
MFSCSLTGVSEESSSILHRDVRYTGGVQCGTRSHKRSGLVGTRDSIRSPRHPECAESVTTCAKRPSAADLPRRAAELVVAQFDTVAVAAEGCDALVATGVMRAGVWL